MMGKKTYYANIIFKNYCDYINIRQSGFQTEENYQREKGTLNNDKSRSTKTSWQY